jgi:hypothetical protein
MAFLRSTGSLILGLAVAFVLVVGVEVVSAVMHPYPPDFDPNSFEACKEHVARYPTPALVMGAVGWALAVFLSTAVATRLGTGRHPAHGILLGAFLFAMACFNMLMLPYPLWFELANVILFPLATFLAIRWCRKSPPAVAASGPPAAT